jgi:hypothetical protein
MVNRSVFDYLLAAKIAIFRPYCTVKSSEGGTRIPIANNLSAIQRVLSDAGVELLFDEGGKALGIKVQC